MLDATISTACPLSQVDAPCALEYLNCTSLKGDPYNCRTVVAQAQICE